MFEITCRDLKGNTYDISCYDEKSNRIYSLTQWDINRKVTIRDLGITEESFVVHACNSRSKEAPICKSILSGNDITLEVPNILLQQELPLIFYIYVNNSDGSAKTVYKIRIPINPRAKPAEYIYEDNFVYMSPDEIQKAIQDIRNAMDEVDEWLDKGTVMQPSVYDPQGKKEDIYKYVDNKLDGYASTVVVNDMNDLPDTGDEGVDYVVNTGSGYLYYKYINDKWEIIGGSLAYVDTKLPSVSEGSEFTDYYIGKNNAYIHYRYIDGDFRVVGGDSYSKSDVDNKIKILSDSISTLATETNKKLLEIDADINDHEDRLGLLEGQPNITYDVDYDNIEDENVGENMFVLYEIENANTDNPIKTIKRKFPIKGGGGDSSGNKFIISYDKNNSGQEISKYVFTTKNLENNQAVIYYTFSGTDSSGASVSYANATWQVRKGTSGQWTTLLTETIYPGEDIPFNISKYVGSGTYQISVTATDDFKGYAAKVWTIQAVDIRIESDFSDRYTTPVGRSVSFTYTPYGAVNKTVHFKIDGVEDIITTSASGNLQSYTIPAKNHGSHLLEVWITARINDTDVETDHIFKDIIWYDEDAEDAVIGCIYRDDYYGTVLARQYDATAIAYNVFDPNTSSPVVKRYVNDELVGTDIISSSYNVWNFKSNEVGIYTLKIEVGNQSVTIKVDVKELGIDVLPITANLEVDFNPSGITNSSIDRIWSNENYNMSVSDNFDWANGGYRIDEENGDTYFLVKAGTYATFDYKLFSGGIDSNPSVLGSEIKLIFKTENVQDANAIWFTNVENNVGIQMGVHEGWLKTNTASNTDIEGDDNTGSIAATNTYLYMPYSEEDIIEMDINIDPLNREDSTAKAFVMAYEDGVPSKAFVYDNSDRFYQYNPQPITIGSEYCDVRIYRLKIYSSSLTTEDVMKNFIADSRDSTTMLARYDRNSIYYNGEINEYTPYSSSGVLDPEKLAPIIPNVKVLMLETDHFTTSKKTFVKSKLRCIHASGGEVFSGDPYLDNWLFDNGWHSGQGTTSDNYGNASRNVDFLFNCDGIHKPSDKVDAEEDYVSQVTLGYGTENAMTEVVTDWKGTEGKVALTRTSVPNNFFNLKVNVASSENVNNALLQKRYNDFLPYISPAKKRDNRIKNTMEFVPAVLFLKETNPDPSTHNEFLDTEWHFYALGNIGDSKKTDYTRAYDPEDMNEFVIEISDNTKNNATFQSGVYLDENGERQIEKFTITETEEDGDIILTPVSTDKPQSFVYPITKEEWENENNMRHWCMYNERFDGDHSFEPRYACCGDYRDGKLVNDTSGRGKAQVELNNDVWRAFYRWVITSTDDEFKNELDQWCVRNAVEFFYAFTHIYTMMDNRAKNTFWHFAKTGVYREVSKPVTELLHIYCELIDGEYVTTSDTEIVSGKIYYTQYAFDLWDYDNDTALGINNNGELIFPYGKEDTDYNIDGNPASGYVFNGATSAFWCRLRDLLPDEIKTTFQTVTAECFSADNLIKQFDEYQECYPEEIWRLDVQRKYIRTFTGESIDNSKPKKDPNYLRDMMQGRKKYQRRQWVRDQEIYFGTKNLMNTVVGDNNRITFRCYTPTVDDIVVPPDYTLKITPYSDMYVSAMFGNGDTKQIRAKAGQQYELNFVPSTTDDTQVTIYGANRIQALNDLSACYLTTINISMADKLKKLVLGNATAGYSNPRLTALSLGNNRLLEELDIRNCINLTGSINLAECNNLLRLYAEGTSLSGVTFATNGKVQVAHLPSTIDTLTMRNLNDLTDFQATLDALETLTLQGGALNSLEIINNCIDTLQVLYLYDIDWTGNSSLVDTTLLSKLYALFYSVITGKVHINGQVRNQELLNYENAWKDLDVSYNPENLVTQYPVTYVNADDKMTVLFTTYVDRGATPPDPYAEGWIEKPTLESDVQYDYSFGTEANGEYVYGSGWNEIESAVLEPRTITAAYQKTLREYTVTWYSHAGIPLGSKKATYGSEVVYDGEIPTRTDEESIYVFNLFKGWDKSTGYITGNVDVYAVWDRGEYPTEGTELANMSPAQIYGLTVKNNYSSPNSNNNIMGKYLTTKDRIDITVGKDYSFPANIEEHTLVEVGKDLVLDGTDDTVKEFNYKLFDSEDKGMTMVIDYEFTNTTTDGTLFSCFDFEGYKGLRLRYNSGSNLQWGNVNVKCGDGRQRNVVVVRRQPNSSTLHYYCFNFSSGSVNYFSDSIVSTSATRTTGLTTNANIVLGAIKYQDTGVYDYHGEGVIHFCKVWMGDLGDTVAKDLASWYRETWTFEYIDTGLFRLASSSSYYTNASFICAHSLRYLMQMNTSSTNKDGWDACKMRQWLNPTYDLYTENHGTQYDGYNRVYGAFPIEWQQLIKRVRVPAIHGNNDKTVVTSYDYIYLPSYNEMANQTSSPYVDEGTYITWFTSNSTKVKFRGMLIPEDVENVQIITSPYEPTTSGYVCKNGDVWINSANNSIGYIFVDDDEIAKYNMATTDANLPSGLQLGATANGGGWVQATAYWVRTASTTNAAGFIYAGRNGSVSGSSTAVTWNAVCPCFSI